MNNQFIPLDKSWVIRCLCLDILNGYTDANQNLRRFELSDDIDNALKASLNWKHSNEIFVGESGTLYRFLKYINWLTDAHKTFIITGTLPTRKISDDRNIINMSMDELLTLDNNTSQWASAAYLCGCCNHNIDDINLPVKVKLTVEAVNHWKQRRSEGKIWELRSDPTIEMQAMAYTEMLNGKSPVWWKPMHSEDYCFGRVFDYITASEGLSRWPNLVNHETNRIIEMENSIQLLKNEGLCISHDHRVIQAIIMYAKINDISVICLSPTSVNKSWPQFWDFIST